MLLLPDGTAIKYNRAAAMLFGLFAPDARFNLARSGMPDLLAKAHQALKDDTPFESEIVFRRPEGNLLLFVKGYVIHQDEDKLLLLTISDLTQQRRMESFRSDFIANVSHEIKTPLTCIVGAVETLQEEEDISPEARAKLLDILAQQSRRLNLLVQDILSLAALERKQNNRRQNFTEVKLDSTLINAMNLCLPKAEEMQIELLITENMPTSVQGDCQLLEQAVVNLINNALTYSGSPRVELALKQEHGLATISVKDFGIGIAPVHHQRIFERFYLVHQERSRELGGTGLGLAIVKHIAQLHHGYAELESTPGKGCTFKINLPL
jgi:two-component system phosphate regulon sensor histidine kinase PhoR